MMNGLSLKKNNQEPLPQQYNVLETMLLYSKVAKMPLCLMVAFSTLFGYFLIQPTVDLQLLKSFSGVFLLACGAASLNSIQEKVSDAAYKRTCRRPVATGQVSKHNASYFTAVNCVLGLMLLALCGNDLLPFFLGLAALIIYNFVYTPLKQFTEISLLAGGISGALPPAIGWTSGGGNIFDPLIWAVMALFFLWQPPHFCLILLEYAEDYRKKRQFTNLITRFSVARVKKIIAIWLLAFLTIVLSLTILPGYLSQSVRFALATGGPLFVALFLLHLFLCRAPRYKLLFVSLNGFMFSIMALLTFSSIIDTI
ncbi:MAG: protoheme IX farnesyltransferase [Desulforhopalus sp.]|jgi:protoheme IX farnesyltransferase